MNRAAPELLPRSAENQTAPLAAEHVGLVVPDVALSGASSTGGPELYGFRITDEIAAGGMAVIYRAVQESLHRPVAIKALRTDIIDESGELGRPNWRDRFMREARILALLKHPNLVEVYDLIAAPGLTLLDDGPLFIVMELCEGIDLLDVLTARPVLPADVATIIALQAARALSYIHEREILHRDVKPANLLLSRRGEVKLIDFGTAWDPMNPRDLRGEERGLGTPSYMSPEQALGTPLDGRSDQFALGAVFYQMLAGRKPFIARPGEDAKRLLEQVVHSDPPSLTQQNRAVPRRLARLVERCLKKRPSERFPSTDALVAELEALVTADPHERLLQFLVDENLLKSSGKGDALSPMPRPAALPKQRPRNLPSHLKDRLKALLRL